MKVVKIPGKGKLEINEVPQAVAGEGQVLVSPKYIGICGSDLHYLADGSCGLSVIREPLTPGHEISAVLDEDVTVDGTTIKAETPVAIHPATFGDCRPGIEDKPEIWLNGCYMGSAQYFPHTHGGMTEKLAVRPDQLRVVPEGLSLMMAALAEPLGVALHAVTLAGDVRGKKILVSGAGPIGLLEAGALVALGAEQVDVSDVLDEPLAIAQKLGAANVYNVAKEALPNNAYDMVFECSGAAPAISASFKAAALGSIIVQVGMLLDRDVPLNLSPINGKEITYIGSFRFYDEFDQALELLASTPALEAVVTQLCPVNDVAEAFAVAKDSSQSSKVMIAF